MRKTYNITTKTLFGTFNLNFELQGEDDKYWYGVDLQTNLWKEIPKEMIIKKEEIK